MIGLSFYKVKNKIQLLTRLNEQDILYWLYIILLKLLGFNAIVAFLSVKDTKPPGNC